MNLEHYRKLALRTLEVWEEDIIKAAEEVLDAPVLDIRPIGSVLDPKRFTEESDIDVAIYLDTPGELDEELSQKVQDRMTRMPIPHIGVVNTLVFA